MKRVRLEIEAALLRQPPNSATVRRWYNVPEGVTTVGDLLSQVLDGSGVATSQPQLLLNGFELQHAEPAEIVRDGDLLQLMAVQHGQQQVPAAAPQAAAPTQAAPMSCEHVEAVTRPVASDTPEEQAGAPGAPQPSHHAAQQLGTERPAPAAAPAPSTNARVAAAPAAGQAGLDNPDSFSQYGLGSSRSVLAAWTLANPLPSVALLTTASQLMRLLAAMPLPTSVRTILQDYTYSVPGQGLFSCGAGTGGPSRLACPRHDWVEFLVDQISHTSVTGPTLSAGLPSTALLFGMPDSGKTFSMPWVQVEAISRLEARLHAGIDNEGGGNNSGAAAAGDGATGTGTSTAGGQPPTAEGAAYTTGQATLAARCPFVVVVPCNRVPLFDTDEVFALLIAVAYLRLPTLFDECYSWELLPDVLRGFIEEMPARQPQLSLRPLQFILQDNRLQTLAAFVSRGGALRRKSELGVLGPLLMPFPPVQLLAGLAKAYHADLCPGNLLEALTTSGRSLHRYAGQPLVLWEELDPVQLRAKAELCKEQEEAAMLMGQSMPLQIPAKQNPGNATATKLMHLQRLGLVGQIPPTMHQQSDQHWGLSDPLLINLQVAESISIYQSQQQQYGMDMASMLRTYQQLKAIRVMSELVRQELMPGIVRHLGIEGSYQLWQACPVGTAPVRHVLYLTFDQGPLVVLSLQHSLAFDEPGEVVSQLECLFQVNRSFIRSNLKFEAAVQCLRACAAGGTWGVQFVSITTDASCDVQHESGALPAAVAVRDGDGVIKQLPFTFHHYKFSALVQPVPSEPLHVAVPLCRAALTVS